MLLEPGSEASLGLSDVDLSTRAWYFVHDVRLLLDGERVIQSSVEAYRMRRTNIVLVNNIFIISQFPN